MVGSKNQSQKPRTVYPAFWARGDDVAENGGHLNIISVRASFDLIFICNCGFKMFVIFH